jgi:hypothetical protein
MSLLDKAKAIKKKVVQVKGNLHLDAKEAEAYRKLCEKIGAKELITIALSEPKTLRHALQKNKKTSTTVAMKIELNGLDAEDLRGLMDEGYTMEEILNVAVSKLNVVKSLQEIEAQEEDA